ncbi:glycosyltransferase [Teredinibacter sp. KSP-S5-2]|uniref:glycosyltransferase n=1 Tax=Teredinibacter sp. KSP-S5-2 TaxID=3034506 RepID=UPI00293507AB|nr:glycosyltransferase [Teredinibacter sp. KSP-S5-2]WNO08125.1 glycosyltransferase [Teredinibacter sp. KSP-S5-2]
MKILHLETGKHLYGGAKQVQFIIEGLQQHGVHNVLCCPQDAAIGAECESMGIRTRYTKSAGDLDLKFLFQLLKILKEEQPDLVHLHSRRGADVLGALACHKRHIPCVLSRRVDNPEPQWLAKQKYKLYDHVITISEGIKNVLVGEGVPESHITCVRSAVKADLYQSPKSKEAFNSEFNLTSENINIGIVAQLIYRKGHRYIFSSIQALAEKHPNIKLLVFGKGPLEEQLKESAKKLKIESVIQFCGFRSDLSDWLGNLDILVHPADMEGLGVSLVQTAAAGVPIIGSAAGGIPEIVRHNENGFLIKPGDVSALTNFLQQLITTPELRAQMGAHGKSIAEKEFSVDVMVQGNLNVYKSVLKKHNLGENQ